VQVEKFSRETQIAPFKHEFDEQGLVDSHLLPKNPIGHAQTAWFSEFTEQTPPLKHGFGKQLGVEFSFRQLVSFLLL